MIAHFFPDGKFLKPFYDQYQMAVNNTDVFYVYRRDKGFQKIESPNVVYDKDFASTSQHIRFLLDTIKKADRVVLHSFFFSELLYGLLFALAPKYGKKMAWLVWGGDLGDMYKMEQTDKRMRSRIRGILRRRIIYHLGYVLGPTNDFESVKSLYKTKNLKKAYAYYSYPIVFRDESVPQNRIMVGHSAHPSSQHIQTYELLAQYPLSGNSVVYSNLSYGYSDKQHSISAAEYIQQVTDKGRELFGDKYLPDLEFCGYDAYVRKLMQIKVVIFNNDRGQGFSNIANMLHLGIKIYMSSQNGLYAYFRQLGAIMYTMEELDASFEQPLSREEQKHNMEVIEKLFSNEEFNRVWMKAMHE